MSVSNPPPPPPPTEVGKYYLLKDEGGSYIVCQSIIAFKASSLDDAGLLEPIDDMFRGSHTLSLEIPDYNSGDRAWRALQMAIQMRPPRQ